MSAFSVVKAPLQGASQLGRCCGDLPGSLDLDDRSCFDEGVVELEAAVEEGLQFGSPLFMCPRETDCPRSNRVVIRRDIDEGGVSLSAPLSPPVFVLAAALRPAVVFGCANYPPCPECGGNYGSHGGN
ncbi:hypothetical protein [Streptomyces sp. XD-27]|uniref:hypothetical protein n=1 Tax=Streptomyces sp. XD-27 TaxID=3062779 RepID=UPI0026F4565F|nr:hypothetical protein [Streptomyces sp. XD-27]WKX70034.1 hypothetical protein Q3Y56_09020 [Streptomyces sp. XD-27]